MDTSVLQSPDGTRIRAYVDKKFKKFSSWTYPASLRRSKCIEYWIAADGNRTAQRIIEMRYQAHFKGELFPLQKAEAALEQRYASPLKFESSDWARGQEVRQARMEQTLTTLRQWKDDGDYQEGEGFFLQLQQATAFLSDDLCADVQFSRDFEATRVQKLTSGYTVGPHSLRAEFDGILGFQQKASLSFSAYSMNWGEINAKLEESFRAGLWANGKAEVVLTRLGFKADVQAAIAMGAEFQLDGECTWRKGAAGLKLAGNCDVFVGARASASAGLSMSAKDGLKAAFAAEAFVGFSATVTGSCAFSYDGQDLLGITATAGVSFGAGAGCEFSLEAPIFGPTTVTFAANVALGLGTTTKASVAIDFTEIYVAGATEFRKVVYLPTLARGYKMDLMNQELKNRVYLDKCIDRFGDEISHVEELLASFERMPMEKRPLLMG